MDNAQKAIMIGVGLFITIIVIAAVMLITGVGQDLLNSGTNQLTGISESLRVQITDQYHGKTFTASQVRTACIDLLSRNDKSIEVEIDGANSKTVPGSSTSIKLSVETVGQFISNGTQKYTGEVTYDEDSGKATVNFKK